MTQHSNEIIPYLYLGDAGFVFEPYSFSLIINCCPEIGITYSESSNVLYLKFNDDPRDNDKLLSLLKTHQVLETIHEHITNQKTVMVPCAMGVQRSASVIACYLLKYGITNEVKNTLEFIRDRREVAINGNHKLIKYDCTFLEAIMKILQSRSD